MTLEVKEYVEKPPRLSVVEVTVDNYDEVAEWAGVSTITSTRTREAGSETSDLHVKFEWDNISQPITFIFRGSMTSTYYLGKNPEGYFTRLLKYTLEDDYNFVGTIEPVPEGSV